MPLGASKQAEQVSKWTNFFEAGFAPWEAAKPASQLVKLEESGQIGKTAIELGCGRSGLASRWLASRGHQAVGMDLVQGAVDQAAATATSEGSSAEFVCADVFDLPFELRGRFDFAFDSQCFHCTRTMDEVAAVQGIASVLVPGGLVLVLTGNDKEPEVGPAVLSRQDLEAAFVSSGLFELVSIEEGRFDPTPHYETLKQCPLCWVALFKKRLL